MTMTKPEVASLSSRPSFARRAGVARRDHVINGSNRVALEE